MMWVGWFIHWRNSWREILWSRWILLNAYSSQVVLSLRQTPSKILLHSNIGAYYGSCDQSFYSQFLVVDDFRLPSFIGIVEVAFSHMPIAWAHSFMISWMTISRYIKVVHVQCPIHVDSQCALTLTVSLL